MPSATAKPVLTRDIDFVIGPGADEDVDVGEEGNRMKRRTIAVAAAALATPLPAAVLAQAPKAGPLRSAPSPSSSRPVLIRWALVLLPAWPGRAAT